jgi:hypothetical protein
MKALDKQLDDIIYRLMDMDDLHRTYPAIIKLIWAKLTDDQKRDALVQIRNDGTVNLDDEEEK